MTYSNLSNDINELLYKINGKGYKCNIGLSNDSYYLYKEPEDRVILKELTQERLLEILRLIHNILLDHSSIL